MITLEELNEYLESGTLNQFKSTLKNKLGDLSENKPKVHVEASGMSINVTNRLGESVKQGTKYVGAVISKSSISELQRILSDLPSHSWARSYSEIFLLKLDDSESKIEWVGSATSNENYLVESHVTEMNLPARLDRLGVTNLNQILFGPPGTGKTYQTRRLAVELADPLFEGLDDDELLIERYNELQDLGRIVFTTFHQSLSYEDFVEGIKPVTTDDQITYEVINGIFKTIALNASIAKTTIGKGSTIEILKEKIFSFLNENEDLVFKTVRGKPFNLRAQEGRNSILIRIGDEQEYKPDYTFNVEATISLLLDQEPKTSGNISYSRGLANYLTENKVIDIQNSTPQPHVLIIDEINRGNVSSIFGELITLIEDDKRINTDNELLVTLPYSKMKFGVPANLHIIGTMNTADRSVEALDTALRRRFSFVEMLPDSRLLRKASTTLSDTNIDLIELFEKINFRLESLLGRDHTLGHAFFMKINDFQTLKEVFVNKVIPQLQEYFYGDWSKIGLILGSEFVTKRPTVKDNDFAKGFSLDEDLPKSYKMTNPSTWTDKSFQSIYDQSALDASHTNTEED